VLRGKKTTSFSDPARDQMTNFSSFQFHPNLTLPGSKKQIPLIAIPAVSSVDQPLDQDQLVPLLLLPTLISIITTMISDSMRGLRKCNNPNTLTKHLDTDNDTTKPIDLKQCNDEYR